MSMTPMSLFYLSISLTVLSNVFYHVFQKLIPNSANPFAVLAVTYAAAMLICFVLIPLYPHTTSFLESFPQLNWAGLALALAIVGLELGFLLAYRSGWNISLAPLVSNVAVALILVFVGLVFFKEKLSLVKSIGIIACVIGLVLINQK